MSRFEWIAKPGVYHQNPAEIPMTALHHLLNIGALATWLSVAGFGTVGFLISGHPASIPRVEVGETKVVDDDFDIGGEASPAAGEQEPTPDSPEPAETLPAPPELPEVAETQPLPEVPSLAETPAPEAQPATQPAPRKPSSAEPNGRTARQGSPSGEVAWMNRDARRGSPSGRNPDGRTGTGTSGMSNASRIAAGRMPSPSYPAEARRKGQTGTVVVQFTVDASGHVTFANAIRPSPWPLLNREAIRTVMLWRFPPGGFMTLERPIVFRLN